MLSFMEIILALKSTPMFQRVPGEGLKRLSDFVQEKTVRAGEVIFREDELGEEMYIVRSGRVSIHQDVKEGRVSLLVVELGGYFGEMAIIDDLPRSASATAEVDTSLFVLHKTDFRSAVQDYPDIAFEILREFSRRLRLADRRHRELMDEANAVSTIRATEDRSGKSQP
ncbi:MAG TPA: cyclic nucleotide-binding domain-containing protein [Vicinamibacteria bacterium]|nr:cyclic nucleotide-binding domain-containing protein [Vicinamibacteria bacterium]